MFRRFLFEFFAPIRNNQEVIVFFLRLLSSILIGVTLAVLMLTYSWIFPTIVITGLLTLLFFHTRDSWRRARQ